MAGDAKDATIIGGYIPGLGIRVSASSNMASTGGQTIFTTTGKVLVNLLIGEVTTSLSTSTSLQVWGSAAAKGITAATSLTAAGIAVGTMFKVTGDADDVLNGSAGGFDIGTNIGHTVHAPFVLNDEVVQASVATAGTGVILWELYYLPLESGATVA